MALTASALLLLALCARAPAGAAEGIGRGSTADPAFLDQYAATYRFTHGQPAAIRVAPDGKAALFLRSGPRSFVRDLYEYDAASATERALASAERLLGGGTESLGAEELARRERMRLAARGIAQYELSEDGGRVLIPLSGRLFAVDRPSGRVRELEAAAGAILDPRISPDGASVAYVRDGDLRVLGVPDAADASKGPGGGGPGSAASEAMARERSLTAGASSTVTHGLAEFVAQEEMDRMRGFWWSPDGRHVAFERADTAGMEEMRVPDLKEPTRPPRAWAYPRPGRRNADVTLGIVPAVGGEIAWVRWDRGRYPYLAAVSWENGAPLTLVVQNRAQTEEAVLASDLSGSTRTLLVETDPAWLNLDPGMPRWLPGGKSFLWSTERSGERTLEIRSADGTLQGSVGQGLGYRRLLGVDPASMTAFIAASPDPAERHLVRVPLGPRAKPVRLTAEPGVHDAVFAKDRPEHVRVSRLLSGGVRFTFHRADGRESGRLASVAERPPFLPNLELTDTGEPKRLRAAIVRPRNFQPRRRYPVLVSAYGGPGVSVATADRDRYLLQQWLADHGFIVVSMDGRGTPGRGRDWERAIKGDLLEAPLADQAEGLKALSAKYPELDLSRVGVYGWSFGGTLAAMAVLRRPEVFHAAAAGAPVADWLDYDTHYTERYLGLPADNPAGYSRSSPLSFAAELSQPLLVIHGTADDNVVFSHGLKLSDALFRAGKDHDFLPLAGVTHMAPDPVVTRRLHERIARHFVRHLIAR